MPITEDMLIQALIRDRAKILAYLRFVTRDADLADDVFQDLSIYAVKKRDQINDIAHLGRWLRQVGRNLAYKELQKRDRSPVVSNSQLLDLMEQELGRYDAQDSGDRMAALHVCLDRLTPYARRLVHCRYEKSLSGQALANELGKKSANTVYVALARVHRTLSACIRGEVAEGGGRHG